MLRLHHEHPWNVAPAEAREVQQRLSRLVETADRLGVIGTVAGVDVGFDKLNGLTRAAAPASSRSTCHADTGSAWKRR
jgi:deoxyribonuclease V